MDQELAYNREEGTYYCNTRSEYTNRRGKVWKYYYSEDKPGYPANAPGTLSALWSPFAGAEYIFYNRNLDTYVDAAGHAWQVDYDADGNMTALIDELAHEQTWEYDAFNNVTSYTDAEGNMVRYYYDDEDFPTLLTRVVEPNDELIPVNPPNNPNDLPDGYPVTRMAYYLSSGCTDLDPPTAIEYGCGGHLKEVTDPNEVWTGYSYDQWGQSNFYREGKYDPSVAGGGTVYVLSEDTDVGSGGDNLGGGDSGGDNGSGSVDEEGNRTASQCLVSQTGGSGSGANWFPFQLPTPAGWHC